MRKIKNSLRVTELDTVVANIIRQYEADARLGEDDFLKATMADIKVLSGKLTEAIKRDRAYVNLTEADTVRDNAIRDLGTLIDGYAAIPPVPYLDKKEAAYTLKSYYGKYGRRIADEPFAVESSLIESLLMDFSVSEAQPAIAALPGVAELLAILRSAQDDFNAASDRQTEIAAADKPPSATMLRRDLVRDINEKLIPYLNTMMMVRPEVFDPFARIVEVEIDRANS